MSGTTREDNGCPHATRRPLRFRPLRALRAALRHRNHFVEAARLMSDTEKEGVLAFRSLRRFVFLFSDPASMQQVLVDDRESYGQGFANRALKRLAGDSFLCSDGDDYKQRALMVKPMVAARPTDGQLATILAIARERAARWRDGQELDVLAEMQSLTADITLRAVLNRQLGAEDSDRLAQALRLAEDDFRRVYLRDLPGHTLLDRLPTRRNRAFRAALDAIDEILYGWIDESVEDNGDGDDLLSRFARLHRESPAEFPRKLFRDELIAAVVAGSRPSAAALTWQLLMLASHPDVQERARNEVDRALGQRAPSRADFSRLEYVNAVFAETIRLYPSVYAFGRTALDDRDVQGTAVPAGSAVSVCPVLSHRSEEHFPDPMKYDPDRWIGDRLAEIPEKAYVPFGLGPRRCPGERLARHTAAIVTATVLQHWSLHLPPSTHLRERTSLSLVPRDAPPLVVRKRPDAVKS